MDLILGEERETIYGALFPGQHCKKYAGEIALINKKTTNKKDNSKKVKGEEKLRINLKRQRQNMFFTRNVRRLVNYKILLL